MENISGKSLCNLHRNNEALVCLLLWAQGNSSACYCKMVLRYAHSLISQLKLRRRLAWPIRSSADGGGLNPSQKNNSRNRTRLIRAAQAIRLKLSARIKEIRKNFPMKVLFFLVGFYCATAFATVIGQTGDWDILSAAYRWLLWKGLGLLRIELLVIYSVRLRVWSPCLITGRLVSPLVSSWIHSSTKWKMPLA